MGIKPLSNNPNITLNNNSTASGSESKTTDVNLVNTKRLELARKLGIDITKLTEIEAKYPNFAELSFDKQLEIVTKQDSEKTQNKNFNKSEYNQKDLKSKKDALLFEVARNIYIHGAKNPNGRQIEAHSEEEWNNLSTEEKLAFAKSVISDIKELLNQDETLKGITHNILDNIDNLDDAAKEKLLDKLMLFIQAANSKGVSLQEFLKMSEFERTDAIENYLIKADEQELNKNDKEYQQYNENLKNIVRNVLKEKYGVELPDNIKTSEIKEYMRLYNLNENEEIYNALKAKKEQGSLSENEKETFNNLDKIYSKPAGQDIINKSKAKNLHELKREYSVLQSKAKSGKLTEEEQETLNILQKTLNTDEAKKLLKLKPPEANGEFEESVLSDIKNLKKSLKSQFNDKKLEEIATLEYVKNKTAKMSKSELEQYLKTFLKFNIDDASNIAIINGFKDKCPNILDQVETISYASYVKTDNIEAVDALNRAYSKAVQNGDKDILHNAVLTRQQVYKNAKEAKYDRAKSAIINNDTKLAEYFDYERATQIQKGAVDVNITVTDSKMQAENEHSIQQGKAYNTDVRKYEIDVLDKFFEENRFAILDGATNNNAEATAYATDNNAISKLGEADRQAGYEMLQSRVNEYFEGEQAAQYSSKLDDQIQSNAQNSNVYTNDQYTTTYTSSSNVQISSAYQTLTNSDINITTSEKIRLLQELTPQEQKDYVSSNDISPKICDDIPSLVEVFVNKGEGMQIVNSCSVPIGNSAIRLMLKNPEERKKLAALNPGRLSKVTYEMVNQNQQINGKLNMNSYKA